MTCIEELPHIQADVVDPLASTDYRPLGVHVGDDVQFAISTAEDTGITFPMLIDYDSSLLSLYSRVGENVILFPLAYLFSRALEVTRIYTETEPTTSALKQHIEAELAK